MWYCTLQFSFWTKTWTFCVWNINWCFNPVTKWRGSLFVLRLISGWQQGLDKPGQAKAALQAGRAQLVTVWQRLKPSHAEARTRMVAWSRASNDGSRRFYDHREGPHISDTMLNGHLNMVSLLKSRHEIGMPTQISYIHTWWAALRIYHSVSECGFQVPKTYQAPAHIWDLPGNGSHYYGCIRFLTCVINFLLCPRKTTSCSS